MAHPKFMTLIILFILIGTYSNAQKPEPIIVLREDYSNPNPWLWEYGTKWVDRKIENGIYKAESINSSISAELKFGLRIEQRNCFYNNEVQLKVMKLKGKSSDFIGIKFSLWELEGMNYERSKYYDSHFSLEYYYLYFNDLGQWKLYKGNLNTDSTPIQSGQCAVKGLFNDIDILHLPTQTTISLNGTPLCEVKTKNMSKLYWSDILIVAASSKTKIGLDEAVFTGYYDQNNQPILTGDIYGFVIKTFNHIHAFAVRRLSETKYKFMDDYGRIRGNATFDDIDVNQNSSNLILVKDNGLYGYISNNGDWVIPAEYTEASNSECYETNADCLKGYFKVKKKDGQTFFVNADGKIVDEISIQKQ